MPYVVRRKNRQYELWHRNEAGEEVYQGGSFLFKRTANRYAARLNREDPEGIRRGKPMSNNWWFGPESNE